MAPLLALLVFVFPQADAKTHKLAYSFRKGDDADSLFRRAGQMLSRARNRGRNRVVFATETEWF